MSWSPSSHSSGRWEYERTHGAQRRAHAVHRKKEARQTCAQNSNYAADTIAWAREVLDFQPDSRQCEVLSTGASRGILNCTRQWGKSTVCAIKAVHHAMFHPESLILVASPSLRQSGEFLRKARKSVAKLGIRPRGDGENRCSLLLPNGSRIVGLPESEDTVRGFSEVGLLIVDEASRVSDEMYRTLRPMLAVGGGALWLLSTPNGKSGFFYDEWSGKAGWTRIKATEAECPRIPGEFLEDERRALGDRMFRQEYCCEFTAPDGALFDEAMIRACIKPGLQPLFPPGQGVFT